MPAASADAPLDWAAVPLGRLEVMDPKDTLSLCLHCRVMVSKLVATHRPLTMMELFT